MIKIAFKLLKVYKVYKYMQPTQQVYIKYFSVLAYFRQKPNTAFVEYIIESINHSQENICRV